MLEVHLVPTSGAGFPLFLGALARFHVVVPRSTAVQAFLIDPDEALVPPSAAIGIRRLAFSPERVPASYLAELRIRSLPLLELEDAAAIRERVTCDDAILPPHVLFTRQLDQPNTE